MGVDIRFTTRLLCMGTCTVQHSITNNEIVFKIGAKIAIFAAFW